jgi:hypothetical protein
MPEAKQPSVWATDGHDETGINTAGSSTISVSEDTTRAQYGSTSAVSRPWLEHFPVTSRFRVGRWFTLPTQWARGRLTSAQLLDRVASGERSGGRGGDPQIVGKTDEWVSRLDSGQARGGRGRQDGEEGETAPRDGTDV